MYLRLLKQTCCHDKLGRISLRKGISRWLIYGGSSICASPPFKGKLCTPWLVEIVSLSFLPFNLKLFWYSTCDLSNLLLSHYNENLYHTLSLSLFIALFFSFWESHSSPPQTYKTILWICQGSLFVVRERERERERESGW